MYLLSGIIIGLVSDIVVILQPQGRVAISESKRCSAGTMRRCYSCPIGAMRENCVE